MFRKKACPPEPSASPGDSPGPSDFLAPSGLQVVSTPALEAKDAILSASSTGLRGVRSIADRRLNPVIVANGSARTPQGDRMLVPMLDLSWKNLHSWEDSFNVMKQHVPSPQSATSEESCATETKTSDALPKDRKMPVDSFAGHVLRSQSPTPQWQLPIKPGTVDVQVEVVKPPTLSSPSLQAPSSSESIHQQNQRLKQENLQLRQEVEGFRLKEEKDRLGLSLSLERLRQELEVTLPPACSDVCTADCGALDQSAEFGVPCVGNPQSAEDACEGLSHVTRIGCPQNLRLQQGQCVQLQAQGALPQNHSIFQQQQLLQKQQQQNQQHASSHLQSSVGSLQQQTLQSDPIKQQKHKEQQQLRSQQSQHLQHPLNVSVSGTDFKQLQQWLQKQLQHPPLHPAKQNVANADLAHNATLPTEMLLPAPQTDAGIATNTKYPMMQASKHPCGAKAED
eukprot:gnl/MRDRNA2_/MRDRNA2_74835_c0_seq3.p1 gnl/MRDRNA2_/MRDRNA2_74835_c0~~gnl/MRDRNA2_/MRDRNA2_74835_c0_seq3.p1  ORF type:complete len:452 (+),score=102.51 gnl/MRDRNA2_/MRDRNA2_74835_c0_seq3:48-1403(+)